MKLFWNYIQRKIRRTFPGVPNVTTQVLADWLEDPSMADPILIDVRAESEFAVSHLRNAIHATKSKSILETIETIASNDADSTPRNVVLYCSVGYRSSRVAKELLEAGQDRVFNLDGSIFQWANEGRPVYREGSRVNDVHPYSWIWKFLLKKHVDASK